MKNKILIVLLMIAISSFAKAERNKFLDLESCISYSYNFADNRFPEGSNYNGFSIAVRPKYSVEKLMSFAFETGFIQLAAQNYTQDVSENQNEKYGLYKFSIPLLIEASYEIKRLSILGGAGVHLLNSVIKSQNIYNGSSYFNLAYVMGFNYRIMEKNKTKLFFESKLHYLNDQQTWIFNAGINISFGILSF